MTYDYRTAALKPVNPAQVLAYLKRQGFEPALYKPTNRDRNLPPDKRFRDGVAVRKHSLRHGWVIVEYHFNQHHLDGPRPTADEWVEGAKRVFEALSKGPFKISWVGDHVGAAIQVVGTSED